MMIWRLPISNKSSTAPNISVVPRPRAHETNLYSHDDHDDGAAGHDDDTMIVLHFPYICNIPAKDTFQMCWSLSFFPSHIHTYICDSIDLRDNITNNINLFSDNQERNWSLNSICNCKYLLSSVQYPVSIFQRQIALYSLDWLMSPLILPSYIQA